MNKELLKKLAQEVVKSKSQGNTTTNIVKVQRPEGTRFYTGKAVGSSTMMRNSQATFNAMLKARNNPADSTTTKQMMMFRGDKKR